MSRTRVYPADVLVLRRRDFGEADRLLTLLTRERGIVRALARGARRPTSKHSGNLEPFVHAAVLLASGRDLEHISQSELRQAHRGIREDLQKAFYAYYLVEVTDALLEPGDPSAGAFDWLLAALGALELGAIPALLAAHYLLKLLEQQGFCPELFSCLGCGEPLQPAHNFLVIDAGGAFCPGCGQRQPGARPVGLDVLKVMRHLLRGNVMGDLGVEIPPALAEAVDRQVREFVEHQLSRRLRSPAFIARLGEPIESVVALSQPNLAGTSECSEVVGQ